MFLHSRLTRHKTFSEADYLLVFFKNDLPKTSLDVKICQNIEAVLTSLYLKDSLVPIFLEMTLFNKNRQIKASTFVFKENAANVIILYLRQRYMEIRESDSNDALNDELVTSFDDFLTRYFLTGGLRLRMAIGYKTSPKVFEGKPDPTFIQMINYTTMLRNSM